MSAGPRSSVLRLPATSSNRVKLPDGKSATPQQQPAAAPVTAEPDDEPVDPFGNDPALPVRWLQQAVMLWSLLASGVVFGMGLYAGCTLLTAVLRASVAMTSVAGVGVLLAHVLMGQIAERPSQAENETRKTT